jgi:hypothetical protein
MGRLKKVSRRKKRRGGSQQVKELIKNEENEPKKE